jgi:heme-degrading monooxygenase HmoA
MIVRRWRAQATDVAGYLAHFRRRVLPALRQISGFRRALILRQAREDAIDIEVLTLWDSMRAIRWFAGADDDRAVVEPEAKLTLRRFDRKVQHFEIILDAGSGNARKHQRERRPPTPRRNGTASNLRRR